MKNILVVGCSSGIGKELTQMLAEKNRVWGTYYRNMPQTNQGQVSLHYLNVLEGPPDVSFLPETLDALVYCPGAISLKPFARIKPEEFEADYKLQVLGAIACIQACLPRLKKSEQAAIVLFSTVAVQTGFPFHSMVSAGKGALEGLCRALAAELAPTIRVNCIAPSITQTPLAAGLLNTPEKVEANAQRHPLKRIGTARDISAMAAFLLGNEGSWITGQVMHVDGGMSAIK